MKETIYNYDCLNEEDITEVIIRVKALIITSSKEILLGKSDSSYQFPGGHLEVNESLIDALKREILEETGIVLDDKEIDKPFYKVTYFNKDYPVKGINRKSEIYYYVVNIGIIITYFLVSMLIFSSISLVQIINVLIINSIFILISYKINTSNILFSRWWYGWISNSV